MNIDLRRFIINDWRWIFYATCYVSFLFIFFLWEHTNECFIIFIITLPCSLYGYWEHNIKCKHNWETYKEETATVHFKCSKCGITRKATHGDFY